MKLLLKCIPSAKNTLIIKDKYIIYQERKLLAKEERRNELMRYVERGYKLASLLVIVGASSANDFLNP